MGNWPIKMDYGRPNAEIVWKIAIGRLLFLALFLFMKMSFQQYIPVVVLAFQIVLPLHSYVAMEW